MTIFKKTLAYLVLSPFYLMHYLIVIPLHVLNWSYKTVYGRTLRISL